MNLNHCGDGLSKHVRNATKRKKIENESSILGPNVKIRQNLKPKVS
jgi:hypothetical protein